MDEDFYKNELQANISYNKGASCFKLNQIANWKICWLSVHT